MVIRNGDAVSGQTLRIGTRKSAMALAQTDDVARLLRAAAPDLAVEVVKFETRGDQDQTSKLLQHGGKGGAFVAEIREAMRAGTLQAAMHSLKDVPGNEETPGLVLAAMLPRNAANDALVLRPGLSLETLRAARGKGFMIGTNAVRRAAYLRRLFPEATVIHFRGAADTRIAKLDRGDKQRLPDGGAVGPADALVMARAGLERIGMAARVAHDFSVDEMLPAVGQGIVTVECVETDWATRSRLATIDNVQSRLSAEAEREVLWVLNGHCNSPIAGHATLAGAEMTLRASVLDEAGRFIEATRRGPASRPRELGRAVGMELLEKGAAEIIARTRPKE
ncbi:hydroxymethylbilane synthase [Bradyrhizobium sp. ISRA443]|uniref:hydroxymethylbilane synthase n=1 Tax=unclassified Bradyrhizobium TaxID=2631580 RepID=UPI002478947B|nr:MULTISPECIES: hydroxymethylbilane synthase [unclassified Bradyrhizobium]WGR91003.1 hydroxymethylbilane synthase [Bradyrhizobium sp. ISRA435]WGS01152.1 hydroxymethylbilane synthase [Bradyrhizobium sp. ISRA436]WGS08039.1 hydroxymethylbilane synthase [Bradyrhizobium sp. ISRA437]WGS14927.1 hydroxymethylbilane synthase [Bradyrhizobium sp. ISRA443]